MRVPSSNDKNIPCPHCGNMSLSQSFTGQDRESNVLPRHTYLVRQCLHCGKLSFLDILHNFSKQHNQSYQLVVHKYPSEKITELDNPAIPEKVKADYIEGLKVLQQGCFKSACVMFRRAIQNAVIELGASKKKKLEDQIDQLEKKRIITPELKDLAHEMRVVGNLGAHPLKDEFDQLTKTDADEMALFLKEFINYCFVLRKRLQDRKAAKSKKKAPDETDGAVAKEAEGGSS